jgi:hypothetical protein
MATSHQSGGRQARLLSAIPEANASAAHSMGAGVFSRKVVARMQELSQIVMSRAVTGAHRKDAKAAKNQKRN